jgi:hypothetical protein
MGSLGTQLSTRLRRTGLDRELAQGADPGTRAELARRAERLRSPEERARIANALVEAVGDAGRNEPLTLRPRPQRAVVREAADELLALALRLRHEQPVGVRGVAMAAWLARDRSSPLHCDDRGSLHEAVEAARAAFDDTGAPASGLAHAV